MYKKWIQSYRDLPILINQWANVLRWEKRTRLFLRTTEFLWQEGHTAHATAEEAQEETLKMLDVYRRFAEEYMALPVITGRKSESEKFAGAVETYAIEAMMQDRRALQAGTSHFLGQNFAKAFDVTFQSKSGSMEHVWAASWGVSTRLVGALIMAHSDDKGLVIPPKIAPTEVVLIPIFKNKNKEEVLAYAGDIHGRIKEKFRTVLDDDDQNSPGWKFSEWEMLGVPVRVEIGPRDMEGGTVMLVRRDTGEKESVPAAEVPDRIEKMLEAVQTGLYERAKQFRDENSREIDSYDEFKQFYEGEGGFAHAPWCGNAECEASIKDETKATVRVLSNQDYRDPRPDEGSFGSCIVCGKEARYRPIFSKAY
jgi:prolyl-tRNA synthetase